MSKKTGSTGSKRTTVEKKETTNNQCCVYDFTSFDVESLDIDRIRADLSDICKKYCFQIERGEKTGKIHYQGRFSLMTKKRMSETIKCLREKGWESFQLSVTSNENKNNDFYVCKEDTRIQGPFTDNNYVYIPKDVLKMSTLRPWQDTLIKNLSTYDERTVDVIFDPIGNNGKSSITRYMMIYKDCELLPFCNDYKDIMRMAYDVGPKKIYLIDMPRAINKEKLFQFFSGVETLKSGYCYDDRYKFQKRLFDRPRICIFTNTYPDISLLSSDMWKVWTIINDELVKYEPPKTPIELIEEHEMSTSDD